MRVTVQNSTARIRVGTEAERITARLNFLPGLRGADGPPNVLSVGAVTTVDPNTLASAIISGTSPSQSLSLSIPQGHTGASLPGAAHYETRSAVAGATIDSIGSGGPTYVRTAGHVTVGDGGHALYKRAISGITEASPTFTAVNPQGVYTGASGAGGGMRDGGDSSYASTWGSTGGLPASLTADLGSSQYVAYIGLRAIPNSFADWGVVYLNGATISTSTDGTTWTIRNGVSGLLEGETLEFEVNATARYVRVSKPTYLAMAEFRVYTASSGTMTARGGVKSLDGAWWDLVPDGGGVNVKQFGAKGDGTTRDDPAFQRALDYLMAKGGGVLRVPRGTYRWESNVRGWGPISVIGEGKSSVILGYGTGDGSDRSIAIGTGLGDFAFSPGGDYTYPLTAQVTERHATGAIATGFVTLTWDDITGLAVGDTVYVWLGISVTDVSTPVWAGFQVITAITPGTGTTGSVTFSRAMFSAIDDPTTVDTGVGSNGNPKPLNKYHRMWKPIHIADNCGVSGLSFKRDIASGNIGYNALVCKRVRNFTIQDIWGYETLISILNLAEGENILVERLFVEKQSFDGAYPQGGSGLSGGGLRSLMVRDSVFNANGIAAYFEAYNEDISFERCKFAATGGATFPSFIAFAGVLKKGALIRKCSFSATGFRRVWEGASSDPGVDAPWQVQLDGIEIDGVVTVQLDGSIGPLRVVDVLSISRPITIRRSFALTNGMSTASYQLPIGWISQVRGFFSDKTGVTVAQLNGYGDGSGTIESLLSKFGTDGVKPISTGLTKLSVDRAAHPAQLDTNTHTLNISTGTVTAGAFMYLEVDLYPWGYYAPEVDAFSPANISAWS